jgi:PAS domain S-box-containing protein
MPGSDGDASFHRVTHQGLAAIVESSEDAIYARAADGTVISWNAGAERLYGYPAAEMLGGTVDRLMPEGRAAEAAGVDARVLAGEHVDPYDTERRRSDGAIVPVSLANSPILDVEGRIVGISSIARDVSERVALIRELARSNADLEQFAYVASHDLGEPLRVIAGMVQLLARHCEGQLDETADDYIRRTLGATVRMRALIDGLLAFSRAARGELELAEVDCDELVAEVAGVLEPSIAEAGARLAVERLPLVCADRTTLSQVFQNLISNAIKFRGAEPPEIAISASSEDGFWRFSIADNGIGIEPRQAERIFKLFSRLHTVEEYPGTGIGLALCQRIVEQHGGRIWPQPGPQGGTIFHFTIARPAAGADL